MSQTTPASGGLDHTENDPRPDVQEGGSLHSKAPLPVANEREDDDNKLMCSASQVGLADNEEPALWRTQTRSPALTDDHDEIMYTQRGTDDNDEEFDRLRMRTPSPVDGNEGMWSQSSSQTLVDEDVGAEWTIGKRKRSESPDVVELERPGKKSVHVRAASPVSMIELVPTDDES